MPHDIKQGDQIKLEWKLGRDVSQASTVVLHVAKTAGGPAIISRPVDVDTNGVLVSTTLSSQETATAGLFFVEIEATWPNGDVVTFPSKGYELLRIHSDLG